MSSVKAQLQVVKDTAIVDIETAMRYIEYARHCFAEGSDEDESLVSALRQLHEVCSSVDNSMCTLNQLEEVKCKWKRR